MTPVVYTNNIADTIQFYVRILGFQCSAYEPDWGWASVRLNNAELMISIPPEHIPFDKPIFTGSFYIHTDKVDEIWEEVSQNSNVCYSIANFEYGMREFAIYDNNGYLLQFGQEIEDDPE